MRSAFGWLIALSVSGAVAGFAAGCGPAPPCETSLVTLDEMRLDAETYEEEAAETGARAAGAGTSPSPATCTCSRG